MSVPILTITAQDEGEFVKTDIIVNDLNEHSGGLFLAIVQRVAYELMRNGMKKQDVYNVVLECLRSATAQVEGESQRQ